MLKDNLSTDFAFFFMKTDITEKIERLMIVWFIFENNWIVFELQVYVYFSLMSLSNSDLQASLIFQTL